MLQIFGEGLAQYQRLFMNFLEKEMLVAAFVDDIRAGIQSDGAAFYFFAVEGKESDAGSRDFSYLALIQLDDPVGVLAHGHGVGSEEVFVLAQTD